MYYTYIACILSTVFGKFVNVLLFQGRDDHIGTIKDIWKNVVGPQLESATGKTFIHGTYHDFVLNVICSYVNDLEDCKIMWVVFFSYNLMVVQWTLGPGIPQT